MKPYQYGANLPTPQDVDRLVNKMKKHLQGKGPELQSAVLADLVSMWVAGHHPALREEALALWTDCMRGLIKVNEAALFEHYGKPEGWDHQ